MSLVRWNPENNIFTLKSGMDRLFDNLFMDRSNIFTRYPELAPAANVKENDDEFVISAEVPGMKKDDIKITFENNHLTISGEKKSNEEIKEENFHQLECRYGKFSRTIVVPAGVKSDKIEADYEQGILTIHLPKDEDAKPKQIEVKIK
jgi:HSP20 family protein